MTDLLLKKHDSWKMFNRIANRYDLLNRLLSFGRDVCWRNLLTEQILADEEMVVVDLATGTGDVLLDLMKKKHKIRCAVGIDPAWRMLAIGRQKSLKKEITPPISFINGDGQQLGIKGKSVDAITMAFGIRNVPDLPAAFREMHRVLTGGGRLLILEFSLPGNRFIRAVYLLYFRFLLPVIGGLISGDAHAYRYLNRTVENFPHGREFCDILKSAGFEQVQARPLTFGVATIYSASNPN
jgi:demethylmenaquinone methyltransferase / 2-methoxy-6-polyprenyl-1,4-benzoquinol methylase